jgi:hypothetical protein
LNWIVSMARRIFAALLAVAIAFSMVVADVDFGFAASRKKQQGGFLDRLFGPPPQQQQSRKSRSSGGAFGNPFLFRPSQPLFSDQGPVFQRPKRPKKQRAPSEPPLVTAEIQPKDPKARKILIIGDYVAAGLAWGLDQALATEPKLAVIDKSNDGSGLVRPDFFDWNKTLPEVLNTEKPDLVVVMVGANDRQQIRTANERLAVGSAPWEKTYTERVDGMVDTLKVYGKPFFWVSAPPMRASSGAGDMAYLNSLYKPRVEAAGGTFVDIWIGFTNANGQYISTGPDLDGQVRQLRTSDGVNFTRAGRMKLSFYIEREIRKKTGIGAGTVDLLPATSQTSTIELGPDGKKRLVGPVMSLSDPQPGASDVLAGGPEAAAPSADTARFRMIVKGDALPEVAGRVDDFAWPPGSRPAAPPQPEPEATPASPGGPAAAVTQPVPALQAN